MFIRFRYWCRHDFFFLLALFTTAAIVPASNFREQGQFSQLGESMARCGLALLVFRSLVLAGVLGLVLNFATALHAADKATEQRDFTIYVDGSQAGAYSMAITEHEDGSQSMAASANVRVSYLAGLRSYRYSYQGTETWKAGRLVQFSSSSNDDGNQFSVSAAPEKAGLRIRVNGREHISRPDIWLSTYWQLADPKFRNQGVPLVDADTGKELAAQLHFVGTRQMNVAGKVQNCTHYQLTGEVQAELWYDAQERLIRLKSVSDGHRYELVLTHVGK